MDEKQEQEQEQKKANRLAFERYIRSSPACGVGTLEIAHAGKPDCYGWVSFIGCHGRFLGVTP